MSSTKPIYFPLYDLMLRGTSERDEEVVTGDFLTFTLVLAAALYGVCLILSRRKLFALRQENPERTTKEMLILSAGLVSVVRVITVLGVAAMNFEKIRSHFKISPPSAWGYEESVPHQLFYDRVMAVLFDLPNCIVVSTYVLLTLLWSEYFVQARLHTESATALRKSWTGYAMIFNVLLYMLQMSLYLCLFLAPQTKEVRNVIYVGITGINFTAVLLMIVFYIYLNIRFSGFPYRSEQSKAELVRVGKVMALWSATRVVWGVATLLVFVYQVELFQDSDTPVWSFIVLLLMFFFCEIIPIISLLDYSYISMGTLDCAPSGRHNQEADNLLSVASDPSEQSSGPGSNPARSVTWSDETLSEPLLDGATAKDDSV